MAEESRRQIILNHILSDKLLDKKIVLLNVIDPETGEIIEEEITMLKEDYNKPEGVYKITTAPFCRITLNKKAENEFLEPFSITEQGYIFAIIRNLDALGRIKYGNNYSQYCRDVKDLSKVLNTSYETLRRNLIPKLKKFNIIRTITIDKGATKDTYISFNPILAVNGVFWDRFTVLVWEDIIRKYNLLKDKQIKKILTLK